MMGRDARVPKMRKCPSCKKRINSDADGMREHSELCKRMGGIGLVMPGVIVLEDEEE